MPTAKLFNMAGDQVGEVALSEAVFGVEPNESVLHDSVKNHLANCRQGTQSALTKGEVSYTTAKPWRQKGTGRARAGYKGSPVWTHGGVAFAPKPRDYSYTLNKKVKRLALKSALSAKAAAGEILVVDGMAVEEIKTAPCQGVPDQDRRRRQGSARDRAGRREARQELPQHPRREQHHRHHPQPLYDPDAPRPGR